jgi:hypothetical protein
MSRTVQIDLTVDPKLIVAKARKLAAQAGGKFEGNTVKGSFTYSGISGEYYILENRLHIAIHQKPSLLPWKLVTHSVQKWFQQTGFKA